MSEYADNDIVKDADLSRGWNAYRKTLFNLLGYDLPRWEKLSRKVRKAFQDGVSAYYADGSAPEPRGNEVSWSDLKKEVARVLIKFPGAWKNLDVIRDGVLDHPKFSRGVSLEGLFNACRSLAGTELKGFVFEENRQARRAEFRAVKKAEAVTPIYYGSDNLVVGILMAHEDRFFTPAELVAELKRYNLSTADEVLLEVVQDGMKRIHKRGEDGWGVVIMDPFTDRVKVKMNRDGLAGCERVVIKDDPLLQSEKSALIKSHREWAQRIMNGLCPEWSERYFNRDPEAMRLVSSLM